MRSLRLLKMFMVVLLLPACATTVKNPVPIEAATQQPGPVVKEYHIRSGDQLEIKFFYSPELNELLFVRPDGRITLQLASDVLAAGLTPTELTDVLRKEYSKEISKPEIAVIVRTFTSQKVFVDGEVNRAGLVPLTDQMTVLQSIAQAGGKKDTALLDGVIVVRRTPDNKLVTMQLNLENAIDNTDMKQDIALMPDDIVFVPKTTIANVNVWVDQYIRKNLPISPNIGYTFGY